MSYINISWVTEKPSQSDIEIERLKACMRTFTEKYESDKLLWFTNQIIGRDDDLFVIGDPIHILKVRIMDAVVREAIMSRKYRLNIKSLLELERSLKVIIERKFECTAEVSIPLAHSVDAKDWAIAMDFGDVGEITIKILKVLEGVLTRITIGNVGGIMCVRDTQN